MHTTVEETVDAVFTAWADGDPDAFVAGYAEDATATLTGAYLPNRAAIRDAMKVAFAGPLRGTTARHTVEQVRYPHADTAVVTGRTTVNDTDPTRNTWLLTRHGGTWRIDAFHNCPE